MANKKADLVNIWEDLSKTIRPEVKGKIIKMSGRGGQYASRDYIWASAIVVELQKIYGPDLSSITSYEEAWKKIHPAIRFKLNHYSPMLCSRWDELKPEEQKELQTSKNWIETEKANGNRGWLICAAGKTFLFSRNYSDKDCSILNYWDNIYQELDIPAGESPFAIDVEMMFDAGFAAREEIEKAGITADSKLEAMSAMLQMNTPQAIQIQKKFKEVSGKDLIGFRLIFPLYYKNVNYMKLPMRKGHEVYNEVIEYANSVGLNLKPIQMCKGTKEEKELFVKNIIDAGGEGVVYHNLESVYNSSDNRSKKGWIKLKRTVSASSKKEGLGDTIDGWISGFGLGAVGTANEGLVSSFEVSTYILKPDGKLVEHHIASLPNITRETQLKCTIIQDGKPTLNPSFYDMVVEMDGQAISRVSRRLTHPRLIRYRLDKIKEDCIITEEFLNSQIDGL